MKKFIIAAVVVLSTVAFTSCTKENVAPASAIKANKLASGDKGNLSQADFTGDQDPTNPPASDKGNLSQADGAGN